MHARDLVCPANSCMCACEVYTCVSLHACGRVRVSRAYKPSCFANTNFEELNRTPPTDDIARRHSAHLLIPLIHLMDSERAMHVHIRVMHHWETVCRSRTI